VQAAVVAARLRIVATLIRTTGDWDLAEDAFADATERALRRWPVDGVPENPVAWLTTTARRRAIDVLRRRDTERAKLAELAVTEPQSAVPTGAPADDRLRLIFTCCHPALSLEAHVALTLRVVADLPTGVIARLFLVGEATMGQRILRAKRKIAHAAIPFSVPPPEQLAERLDGVLAVIYLVFTRATSPPLDDPLATEAIRLGRLLVELLPRSDEATGLLALMLLHHARRTSRLVDGELVTLEQQDRAGWDAALIAEARSLLSRCAERGPYRIQADLAAVHMAAPDAGRRTGCGSSPSTTSCSPCVRRRSSPSTGPWRWRWSTAHSSACAWSTRSPASWSGCPSLPRCAASCSPAPVDCPRRAPR
jgi:RNA polymerase sigma-70 factor, ECF subfamily